MRSTFGICGAIATTLFLSPGVRAIDRPPLLTLSPVHSNVTTANSAQEVVRQSEPGTTTVQAPQPAQAPSTTTVEVPKPTKPAKVHVQKQRVIEHTTTVSAPRPPKPPKEHVTQQRTIEHTTTVKAPKAPKPPKVHVTEQRVIESTTTVQEAPKPTSTTGSEEPR